MRIIKLNAIDSTNSFLRQMSMRERIEDFTVVVAEHQMKGKGQMGTTWSSQYGKNLTVSVFKDVSFLKTEQNFYLNIVVSLSVLKALKVFHIPKLKVKWPNDILSDKKKLSGILIENVIKQNQLQASVVGIGLNVNQTEFEDLPNASSMRVVLGRIFEKEEILQVILNHLKSYFQLLENGDYERLKVEYEKHLFRKDKPSTFKNAKGEVFSGIITGISDFGQLQVRIENEIVMEYDLKEITLLY